MILNILQAIMSVIPYISRFFDKEKEKAYIRAVNRVIRSPRDEDSWNLYHERLEIIMNKKNKETIYEINAYLLRYVEAILDGKNIDRHLYETDWIGLLEKTKKALGIRDSL